jgi:hypothetical protein
MKCRKFSFDMTRTALLLPLLLAIAGFNQADAQERSRVKKWYVPDYAVVQYAGSVGFVSAGAGYNVLRDRANVDFLFGYVPAFAGGVPLETFTIKFTANLWTIPLGGRTTLHPLTTGLYFCYTPGKQYSSNLPSWYPEGYYWWSEAIRANIFIGGSLDVEIAGAKKLSRLNIYYELGTNEIKLVSYVQNAEALRLVDIVHAGIGVRLHF